MNRFLVEVGRLGLDVEHVDERDVQNRFDIMWSRVELFRVGEVGAQLSAYDQNDLVGNLRKALKTHEGMVLSARRDDSPTGWE